MYSVRLVFLVLAPVLVLGFFVALVLVIVLVLLMALLTICIREEELGSTRESINKIKTALEQGLKEMEASRSIVRSQLDTGVTNIIFQCQTAPFPTLILNSIHLLNLLTLSGAAPFAVSVPPPRFLRVLGGFGFKFLL